MHQPDTGSVWARQLGRDGVRIATNPEWTGGRGGRYTSYTFQPRRVSFHPLSFWHLENHERPKTFETEKAKLHLAPAKPPKLLPNPKLVTLKQRERAAMSQIVKTIDNYRRV
ncbi:hypothetical protein DD238_005951 [Peronospora effusa]|uniref:Uncharacterized protein n=1 Tax=Peronospora effusa TaxID=542832 RepID=A0A3M6VR39_9STRA|nr:hypothetical protein DD238_005951 [Peronospora effusa]